MRVLSAAALILFSSCSVADVATTRLICTYDYTLDAEGKRSETTGSDLVTVVYNDEGVAVIKKENLGAEFYGTINDEEIHGTTEYSLGNLAKIKQDMRIYRFTGSYVITFGVPDKNSEIVHFGKCELMENPLF